MCGRIAFGSAGMAWITITCAALLAATAAQGQEHMKSGVTAEKWGELPDGRGAQLFTVTNAHGMTMRVSDYGAIIVSLTAPDRSGKFADIVLGYDKLADYLKATPYFGAVVGRYGNRIAAGKFTLGGEAHMLATNNDPGGIPCHLHGGNTGFDKVLWDAEPAKGDDAAGVRFHYRSKDGEEGYPGNLDVNMTYWLTDDNELRIEYEAKTDKATPINVTHHSYFNLAGHDSGTILNHELMINAEKYTPVNKGLIPTGELAPVAGTPFDFRKPKPIGRDVNADSEQIKFGGGYDHNFVLEDRDGSLKLAVRVIEPSSGRVMEVLTTEPGMQFYCGNFLDGSNIGKGAHAYEHRTGFCLEAQHYPDSPNQPNFPSTILKPGEKYGQTTVYRFSTK